MELVDVPEVDYRNIKVTHVTPPNEFKNKMRPNGIMKNSWSAKPYMEWLKDFVEIQINKKNIAPKNIHGEPMNHHIVLIETWKRII